MLHLPETLSLANLEENMIFIEGEVFEMGGESFMDDAKPIHKVQISDFELCRYPVSQQLWKEVMGENPERIAFQNPHRPVERVSWEDITERFLPALREKTGKEAYCLPTEAQWEYAVRGGRYGNHEHEYAGSDYLKEVGWYNTNSHGETQPLSLKHPNALGLYGMSGNVWEWCQDNYDSNYYQSLKDQYGEQPAPDPKGPKDGNIKVVRGGSWDRYDVVARVALRLDFYPDIRYRLSGFRLCRYPSG